jgi:uncharacterized membrane protein YGL010W
MQLHPLVCSVDFKVFLLELDVLGGLLVLVESVRTVAVADAGLAHTLVAHQDQLPLEVRGFIFKLVGVHFSLILQTIIRLQPL